MEKIIAWNALVMDLKTDKISWIDIEFGLLYPVTNVSNKIVGLSETDNDTKKVIDLLNYYTTRHPWMYVA